MGFEPCSTHASPQVLVRSRSDNPALSASSPGELPVRELEHPPFNSWEKYQKHMLDRLSSYDNIVT
jgi:hypothetical protein